MNHISTNKTGPDVSTAGRRSWLVGNDDDAELVAVFEQDPGFDEYFPSLPEVEQVLVVLSGELALSTSDGEKRAPARSMVFVPRGVGYRVSTTEATRFLKIAAPVAGAYASPSEAGSELVVLNVDETGATAMTNPAMGMFGITTRPVVTSDTVDASAILAGHSEFAANEGLHELHRHDLGEFMYFLSGTASALHEDGDTALSAGDLIYIPAGEWHGLRATGSESSQHLFGYLGAASFPEAGYALKDRAAKSKDKTGRT